MKLQQYYCKREHQKVVETIKVGMFIAVHVKSKFWTRGKIVKVNSDLRHVTVLLIDEGFSQIKNTSQLFDLPDYLMIMPPMCNEVYLCNVQPMDKDLSWTLVATNTIKNTLVNPKNPESTVFRGKINFALNNTLWLGPVKPLMKIGTHICPEVPLRNQLCSEGFGEDNPLHLKRLQDLWQNSELSTLKLLKDGWVEHYKLGEMALKSNKHGNHSVNSMASENFNKSEFPINNKLLQAPTNVSGNNTTTKINRPRFQLEDIDNIVVDPCEGNNLVSPIISHNENCDSSSFEIKNLGSSDVGKEKSLIMKNRESNGPKLEAFESCTVDIMNSKLSCDKLNFVPSNEYKFVDSINIDEQISDVRAVNICELQTENKVRLNPTKSHSDFEPLLSESEGWKSENLLRKKLCDEDLSNFDDNLSDKTNNSPHDLQESECVLDKSSNSNELLKSDNGMSELGRNFLDADNDGQINNELELFSINNDFENNAIVPYENGRPVTEDAILYGEERLTIGDILEIDVAEIISPFQFYIRKAKNNDRLSLLEDQIQLAMKDLKIFDNCLPGDICLSQFNDGRFYRGQILNVQNEFCNVFFLDHGETMEIAKTEIYPCPLHIFEAMPAQCLECQLADVDIPEHLLLKATECMEETVDVTGIWMLEVMNIGRRNENIVYIVDLIDTTRTENKFLTQSLLEKKVVLPASDKLINIENGHKIVEISESESPKQAKTVDLSSLPSSGSELAMLNEVGDCLINDKDVIKTKSVVPKSLDLPTSEVNTLPYNESLDLANIYSGLTGNINLPLIHPKIEKCWDSDVTFSYQTQAMKSLEINSNNVVLSESTNLVNSADPKKVFDSTQPLESLNQQSSECMAGLQDKQLEVDELDNLSDGTQQTSLTICDQKYKTSDVSCQNSLAMENRNGGNIILNSQNNIVDVTKNTIKRLNDVPEPIATSSSLEDCINIKSLNSETEQTKNSHSETDNFFKTKCDCRLPNRRHRPKPNRTKVKNHTNTLIKRRCFNDKMPPLEDFSTAEINNPLIRNPGTYWRQDEERIYLRFSLFDVSEYECKIYSKKLIFQTSVKDAMYNFHEELFAAIDPDRSFIKAHGLYTAVSLHKQLQEVWPRLLLKDGPVPWLRKDVSIDNMDDSDSSDDGPYSYEPLTAPNPNKEPNSPIDWNQVRMLPSEPSDVNSDSYSSSDDDIFKFG